MSPPNGTWQQIIAQAASSPDVLKQPEVMRNLQNILQTNVSVCQVNCISLDVDTSLSVSESLPFPFARTKGLLAALLKRPLIMRLDTFY